MSSLLTLSGETSPEKATEKTKRLLILDVLRGIAVLGILFLNIYSMGMIDFAYVDFDPRQLSDLLIDSMNAFFFDGRFRSLFCLLFGIGIYLQIKQQQIFEQPELKRINSRLKWLLFFGFIHCSLIWSGDILMMYAICGLLVKKQLTLPPNELLTKGIKFTGVGLLILAAQGALTYASYPPVNRGSEIFLETFELWTADFIYPFFMQLYYTLITLIFFPVYGFYFCGLMLLGVAAYQLNIFTHGIAKRYLPRLWCATLCISLLDVLVRYYLPFKSEALTFPLSSFSGLLMAFLIIDWLVKNQHRLKSCTEYFANVGRLSFSFYILQSISMVALFRYWQPQLQLSFTRLDYLLLTLGFCLVQLMIAHWYFKFFTIGPLEKLWRTAVNSP